MRHRRTRNYRARHAIRVQRRHSAVPAVALTACALAATASTILLPAFASQPVPQDEASPLVGADDDRFSDAHASRLADRGAQQVTVPGTVAQATPTPTPTPAPPTAPARPAPVAGLTQAQMDNAATIVTVARQRGLSKRAMVIGVATALQESDLYNQANPAVRASMALPHEGASVDHDSVGLFQQRASQGWGTVAQLMDPAYSAGAFFSVLVQVPGWDRMALSTAAQSVQRSAFPWAYAKWESTAQQIVNALAG